MKCNMFNKPCSLLTCYTKHRCLWTIEEVKQEKSMTYPETLTQKPERHEAFILFQPYNSDGELTSWTKLEFSYTEVEYVLQRTDMHIAADRPYEWVSDEDIEQTLKDFYSDKTILTLTIS